jgi:hypothetical protein
VIVAKAAEILHAMADEFARTMTLDGSGWAADVLGPAHGWLDCAQGGRSNEHRSFS